MARKVDWFSRRQALGLLGRSAIAGATLDLSWLPPDMSGSKSAPVVALPSRAQVLDANRRTAFRFFWEQASPATGLMKDRAATHGTDVGTLSSIASSGFGLAGLCIADSRRYRPSAPIKQRVITALNFLLTQAPTLNGFFYHFMNMNTGARAGNSEVSSADTPSCSVAC